jgi:arylsulfatase
MAERPNVLLVTTDHWFGALLGSAGHPAVLTPTLDALARSGVRFTQAYAECPICIPARRSLMTGTSPRTHGDRVYRERLAMPNPGDAPADQRGLNGQRGLHYPAPPGEG